MTRDADHRTPLDDVIDQVAHAMTLGPTPDLRPGVGERLGRRAPAMPWVQPALAAVAVLAAMVAWWMQPAPPPLRPASPPAIAHNRQPAQPMTDLPIRPPASMTAEPSPNVRVTRNAARVPPSSGDTSTSEPTWPAPTNPLPAIEVDPIAIDALAIVTAVVVDEVQMPKLVVEPLDVEPLPRSNP